MMRRIFILSLSALFFFTIGCSEYNRVSKGNNLDAKLELAIKLYQKGDYFKALPLLEELMVVYRGTKKAEQSLYYYAYTNYKIGDYSSAAFDFENFVKTFPNSEYTEECAYMQAYCYYEDSPNYSLDQTNTYKAIGQLQLFIDRFPLSSRVEESNKLIDQLESKLEQKFYSNAKMYFDMEDYKAAVTAFRNLLNDFPMSPHREISMFLMAEAQYRLAMNSVEEKKLVRMNEALAFYGEFIMTFPESKSKKEAEQTAREIREILEKNSKSTFRGLQN
ncbi:MAG: outer membrane protein assembly factor BamD [Bacteroidota bacterium]